MEQQRTNKNTLAQLSNMDNIFYQLGKLCHAKNTQRIIDNRFILVHLAIVS